MHVAQAYEAALLLWIPEKDVSGGQRSEDGLTPPKFHLALEGDCENVHMDFEVWGGEGESMGPNEHVCRL
jgi:hypothetical protein